MSIVVCIHGLLLFCIYIVVFPHILHSFTESNKLISLSSTTSTHSLVLNVTVNNFHYSISTDCLFYTGTVTNGSVETVLGWTTLSICDDKIVSY